jgi:hypothetical protein
MKAFALAVLLALAGCASVPPREVQTGALGCKPFEILIVRGLHYRVATLAGAVHVQQAGAPDVPLDNVHVVLRRLGAHEQLAATVTDANGRFAFPTQPDGWYQLETCRDGFNSTIVPVLVTRHPRGAPLVLRVGLAA